MRHAAWIIAVALCLSAVTAAGSSDHAGGLLYETEGDAGAWVIAYDDLAGLDCSRVDIELDVQADAAGGATAIFLQPPGFAMPNSDGFTLSTAPTVLSNRDGGPLSVTAAWSEGWSGACRGTGFAVSANGPWTARIVVRPLGSGDLGAPDFVSSGTGSTFTSQSSVATAGLAGSVKLSEDVPAGWHHVQFDRAAWLDAGARTYEVAFASDARPQLPSPGVLVAGKVPMGPGCCVFGSNLGYFSVHGHQSDAAGQVSASLHYAEGSRDVTISMFHLPVQPSDWPAGFTPTRYQVSTV